DPTSRPHGEPTDSVSVAKPHPSPVNPPSPGGPGHYAEFNPRDILSSLTNLNLSPGRLTAEQAAQLRQSFQAIASQGSTAVPLIQSLLKQKVDSSYGKGSGDTVGVPSFRLGLMDTLRQIGGP